MTVKLLKAVSAFLSKQTPWVVSATAVGAYFLPGAFSWVRGNAQNAVLGVIMLAMGMTLTKRDFAILASRPFDIAVGTLAQFALMPLIALGLSYALGLPRPVAAGLMLVGCCPGGVSSNIMSFLCRGDVAFSVGLTTLSTLAAPLMTPLLMTLLAGASVEVDAVGMFKSILFVTLVPVAVGFTLNSLFSGRRGYADALALMPGVAVAGLACIVGGVVSAQGARIVESGAKALAAVFLHNGTGYALGYLVGVAARFASPKRRTISIEVGMQNAGLATVLATRHFPTMPEAAMVSAVSCVWHSVTGALMAGVFNAFDALVERRRGRGNA